MWHCACMPQFLDCLPYNIIIITLVEKRWSYDIDSTHVNILASSLHNMIIGLPEQALSPASYYSM